ncbi:BrnT family toxin [Candidatus Methylopumilus turicensis]|uniref:BrnT family toxin n=1 Tax=Candidatus Methylopumilus turicensis TaxID=1581680 RepID=A0A0B7IZD5_9PROT|nr:BrnT family toxin [Candidatus Methylopumilus turicensis]CEN56480.1 conserved protein of unknown function [Candidatus Methylopumilus turicensis]
MKFTFDANKDAINLSKHNLSLAEAEHLDWVDMLSWVDDRQDYGEVRQIGLVPMKQRLYVVVFVDKKTERRIISLRKANLRECERYEQEIN